MTSLAAFRTWAATLKGDVILPVDSAYDAARRIWNLDIDRRPAVIVRCADEDDVVRAVDLARTRGLIVAVRSGGHSQAGHSVCDGGMLIFPVSRARDVIRRYRDLMAGAPDELETSGGITSSDAEPALFIAVCHCGDDESADSLIRDWRASLQPESDNVKWMPYSADFTHQAVASSGTGIFLPELSDDVIDVLAEYFSSAPPLCTAAWNDYHGAVTRVPPDAMAFPLRRPGYDVFVHASWKTAESRRAALTWLSELHGALRPGECGLYVNNIGTESAEQTAAAYGANFERLKEIKATYDPDNFFRLNHNIRPFDE